MSSKSRVEPLAQRVSKTEALRMVVEAYDIVLRRWPDEAGLTSYSEMLQSGGENMLGMIRHLYLSRERTESQAGELISGDNPLLGITLSEFFNLVETGTASFDDPSLPTGIKLSGLQQNILQQTFVETLLAYKIQ